MLGKRLAIPASAVTLGTTLLTQPVCAAVCPKGIGGCPYPGRCFLFTDADGNSFCDYTRTAVTGTPQALVTAPQPTAPLTGGIQVPVATPDPTTTIPLNYSPDSAGSYQEPVTSGISLFVNHYPLLTGGILFLVIMGISFLILRYGPWKTRARIGLPLIALASWFALGISAIIVYQCGAGTLPAVPFAIGYMLAGTSIATYLWIKGGITWRATLGILAMSTATGFVFLSPLMPIEFGSLSALLLGKSPLLPGVIAILVILALALVSGRAFCGHVCPVGAIQELASRLSPRKIGPKNPLVPEIVRGIVFVAILAGALYSVDLMVFTGVNDFFSLSLTAGFLVFAGLLVLAIFLYRPVCRFLCPFGLIFSILSQVSIFKLHRTSACIDCHRCEKVCPVGAAGEDAPKRECYLCGRCLHTCPKGGAIAYGRTRLCSFSKKEHPDPGLKYL